MRKFVLKSVGYSELHNKWYFHTGTPDNPFIYFKAKKEAEKFQRFCSKFTFTLSTQANSVYSELFSTYRDLYFSFPYGSNYIKEIEQNIEHINFQFNRWSNWQTMSSDYSNLIFNYPKKVINSLIDMLSHLRSFCKKNNTYHLIHKLDNQFIYLNFLRKQHAEFNLLSNNSQATKVYKLKLLPQVSA